MAEPEYGEFVPGQDYVAPGAGGGYDVVVGGELKGNVPDQGMAEGLYNTFFPPTAPTDPTGNRPPGGLGGYPSAVMDPATQMAIARMNAEIEQRRIDYQYARMELIEAREVGTAEAAQKAQQAYQEALVALQTTQQSQKQLMDWVGTQVDIWKQQNIQASEMGAKTGLYSPPSYTPTLPPEYYAKSGLSSSAGEGGGTGSLDAAGKIYDWAEAFKKATGGAAGPKAFEARWGEAGKIFAAEVIRRNKWPSREEVLLDPAYTRGVAASPASPAPAVPGQPLPENGGKKPPSRPAPATEPYYPPGTSSETGYKYYGGHGTPGIGTPPPPTGPKSPAAPMPTGWDWEQGFYGGGDNRPYTYNPTNREER